MPIHVQAHVIASIWHTWQLEKRHFVTSYRKSWDKTGTQLRTYHSTLPDSSLTESCPCENLVLLEVRSGGLTEQLISKTGSAVHRWTHYLCTQLGDTRTPHSICLAWFVEIIVFFLSSPFVFAYFPLWWSQIHKIHASVQCAPSFAVEGPWRNKPNLKDTI